jgi:hypothetical protein
MSEEGMPPQGDEKKQYRPTHTIYKPRKAGGGAASTWEADPGKECVWLEMANQIGGMQGDSQVRLAEQEAARPARPRELIALPGEVPGWGGAGVGRRRGEDEAAGAVPQERERLGVTGVREERAGPVPPEDGYAQGPGRRPGTHAHAGLEARGRSAHLAESLGRQRTAREAAGERGWRSTPATPL